VFLSQLLHRPVTDAAGERLGRLDDLVASQQETFPLVSAIQIERGGEKRLVPWSYVDAFNGEIHLSQESSEVPDYVMASGDFFIRRSLMDKQIVDVHNLRVVRINDVNLARVEDSLRLIGVDAGFRGLLRQIGLERAAEALVRLFGAALQGHMISWADVEPLDAESDKLRLRVPIDRITRLHPADIAGIVDQLDPHERAEVLEGMDTETAADVIAEMEPEAQAQVIDSMEEERASDILEEMEPDEAADVLGDLPKEKTEDLLRRMEEEEREDVEELLAYSDESAGGLMTTEYIALRQSMTVDETIAFLRQTGPDAETIYYLYVVDEEERLVGVVSLRDMIVSFGDVKIEGIMERQVVYVRPHDSPEAVAQLIGRYDLLAVPVVDDDERLVGIVTVDDVVDRYLPREQWRRRPRWSMRTRG
jgi:magnesium transporter